MKTGRPRLRTPDQVLSAIRELESDLGVSPTLIEIRAKLGVKSVRTVQRYVDDLEERGRIERRKGESRGITVIGEDT